VHTFTPRMKIAPLACNAPHLEIYHPRTVHIFHEVSQVLKESDSIRGNEMMYHVQGDGAWRNKFLHGTHDFASCCHAAFPTASVHVSHQKARSMCTFLKNRVRFASRVVRPTCTKNSVHATSCLRKMVHNDLHGCVYHRHCAVLGALCVLGGGLRRPFRFLVFDVWSFRRRRLHQRAHFFAGVPSPTGPARFLPATNRSATLNTPV